MEVHQARHIATTALNGLAEALERGQSEPFKRYLAAMSRFHMYSPRNIMLIRNQRAHTEQVASYSTWKRLGRSIMRGERGIAILAPIPRRSLGAAQEAKDEPEGTLNPAPESVRDPKFRENEFFDPRDVVQVKYEMLRRVSVENASVTDVAAEYGVSRPTYYQAKACLEEAGIPGLVPKKPGPRGPHKLQGAILAFLKQRLIPGEPIRGRTCRSNIAADGTGLPIGRPPSKPRRPQSPRIRSKEVQCEDSWLYQSAKPSLSQ